jgi:hypothetical protein
MSMSGMVCWVEASCINLSRGRHGCVFEDAERDVLWRGMVCCVRERLVTVRRVRLCHGAFRERLGMFNHGPLSFKTTLSVSERAAASVAEWDCLWFGTLRNGSVSSV